MTFDSIRLIRATAARHLEDVEPPLKKRPPIPYETLVERPDLVAALVEEVLEACPER